MERRKFKQPESFEESVELSMKGYANNLRKLRKGIEVLMGVRTKANYVSEEGWDLPDSSRGYRPGIYEDDGTGELKRYKGQEKSSGRDNLPENFSKEKQAEIDEAMDVELPF